VFDEISSGTRMIEMNVGKENVPKVIRLHPVHLQLSDESIKGGGRPRIDNGRFNGVHEVTTNRTLEIEVLEIDTGMSLHGVLR